MSSKKEKVTTPVPNNSSGDPLANFEWAPYQVGTEDQRDSQPIVRRQTIKKLKPPLSPSEEFFNNFEWGPFQTTT